MEQELLTFAMNNGVGVLFGLLMFWQSTTAIKKNTEALDGLRITLEKLAMSINGKG